jgi:hypothetical protein
MKTNGCTYGADLHCGHHGTPWETDKHVGHVTMVTICPTPKVGPRGVWMKRAGERRVKPTPLTKFKIALDTIAHRAVSYEGPGYRVRKGAAK